MSTYLKIFSFSILTLLCGCDQQAKESKNSTQTSTSYEAIKVSDTTINNNIEQTGVIKPLTHNLVVSPVTGFITEQLKPYGTQVSKGDVLFKISDTSLSEDVFNDLVNYQNAKWDFQSNKNKYMDNKLQLSAGLISQDQLNLKEIEFKQSEIKFIQAEFELQQTAIKLNRPIQELTELKISDLKEKFLQSNIGDVVIYASDAGALIPLVKDGDNKSIARSGSKVESGQAFAALANMNTGEIQIELDEQQVLSVKHDMPVQVASLSRPELKLTGHISAIKFFEYNQKSDSLVRYPVDVKVASETDVPPGTRCKVTIPIGQRKSISIPIRAINDPYKAPFVFMMDGTKRVVKLGKTSQTDVEVISGLKPGETILAPKVSKPIS
tara:strand:+ start:247 stop:1389 length:1143 start_codon:yes stop_codon:yes gene_type:complete